MRSRREAYAEHIIACADTVTLLTCEEVLEIYARARSGEFDADLDWRSPYLNSRSS